MRGIVVCFLLSSFAVFGQALSFEDAKAKGIFPAVDSIYKSAIDSDANKAVFKTEEAVQKHINAYQNFLLDFGQFLLENKFEWDEDTRCFNRIYLSPEGKIDYFLYQFKTPVNAAKEKEFNRLLNLYISNHNFGITAPVKFAQCSPVTYPKSN
jgi:hypothetical protein